MKGLYQKIISVLTPDLIQKKYRKNTKTLYGYCYIVSEAIYHLFGKHNGYFPYRVKHKNETHWYLQNKDSEIIDIIADSYKKNPFKYQNGTKTSFLTKEPSKRCQEILKRIK